MTDICVTGKKLVLIDLESLFDRVNNTQRLLMVSQSRKTKLSLLDDEADLLRLVSQAIRYQIPRTNNPMMLR